MIDYKLLRRVHLAEEHMRDTDNDVSVRKVITELEQCRTTVDDLLARLRAKLHDPSHR